MIDHLAGRPNPSWKRAQVILVIIFWLWRILGGDPNGPRMFYIRRANRAIKRFTPWQIVVSTLTAVYAIRHLDKLLGLGAPEPLARLYSPSYYRATWIATGLDAGFATAMAIRPKWLRDVCSVIFSAYYIIYAQEGDEKLRRFRAVPTIEMLRSTWEKTTNPYIRLFLRAPRIAIYRKFLLPRPASSRYTRPITVHLYFSPPERHPLRHDPAAVLALQEDLILDFPGGGFVAMTPEHHEERLKSWAKTTGRPVLSVEYGKAPEYPYPFAIHEAYDTYRVLVESKGKAIGMSGTNLQVIMTGDSAGATILIGALNELLEHPLGTVDPAAPHAHAPPLAHPLPLPVALVLNYAALDFNFTSWMSPRHLRILLEETEADEARAQAQGRTPSILGRRSSSYFYRSDEEDDEREGWASEIRGAKDHLAHVSPLAVVGDSRRRVRLRRKKSWREALKIGQSKSSSAAAASAAGAERPAPNRRSTTGQLKFGMSRRAEEETDDEGAGTDGEGAGGDVEDYGDLPEEDRPIQARVRWSSRTAPSSPVLSKFQKGAEAGGQEKATELLDVEQQARLEAAVVEADHEVGHRMQREGQKWKHEPIGTRLTMTSRTGYFQDRIISPSMMRAMAILYIGPHLNPDFATDYRISPILTPARLLAQYPPLLMQCGEKDPFVDDTIIFAGRIRDAKRLRKEELRAAVRERGAGAHASLREAVEVADLEKELERLEGECEEDWVQMQIFTEWSHGYLQMPTLLPEAKAVIRDIADWMDDMFTMAEPKQDGNGYGRAEDAGASASASEPADRVAGSGSKASFVSRLWPWSKAHGVMDGSQRGPERGRDQAQIKLEAARQPAIRISAPPEKMARGHETPFASSSASGTETETENDEGITFVPKARRRDGEGKGSFGSDETVGAAPRNRREDDEDGRDRDDRTPVPASISRADRSSGDAPSSPPLRHGENGGAGQLRIATSLPRSGDGGHNGIGNGHAVGAPGQVGVGNGAAKPARAKRGDASSDVATGRASAYANGGEDGAEERASRSRTRSPKGDASTPGRRSGTPGKGGVAGQTSTISESELIRRRRLLDSHIFVSEQ
ncbi:alpha/beta-hydrolase [Dentipellis sp. KUC8613]|nr:alpha/beta-hydrolase [Dentipellis sp. KUC8613]